MGTRAMVPLIDMVFLTLGGILAAMTQMQHVTSLPVEVTRIGPDTAVVQQADFQIVAVTEDGLALEDQAINEDELLQQAAGAEYVLRIAHEIPTSRTLQLLARLTAAGAEVSLEVDEQTSKGAPDSTGGR